MNMTSPDLYSGIITYVYNNVTYVIYNTSRPMAYHQYQPEFGHSLSPAFSSIAAFFFILIIITSVCCNIALILIIIRVRSLHTVMHVFIVNLAVSDLITSAGTMPFDVDYMIRGHFDHGIFACGVMNFTFLISLPSSVLNLVLLTTERLISVLFPFQRLRYLKKRNVIILLVSSWIYTFCVALYPVIRIENPFTVAGGVCRFTDFQMSFNIFQLVANFSIPIIYICIGNCILFYISNKHASKIKTLTVPLRSSKTEDEKQEQAVTGRRRTMSVSGSMNLKLNLRAAKKLALLVGVFLFCWLTYIILVATNISCGICHPRELTWIGNIINYSSSAVNPLLYGLLNSQIRREIKKPLRQFWDKFFKTDDINRNHKNHRQTRQTSFISEFTTLEQEV